MRWYESFYMRWYESFSGRGVGEANNTAMVSLRTVPQGLVMLGQEID